MLGVFSFTCCAGCEFSILFLDSIIDILTKFDVQHFHLIKEKNREAKFDLAVVEGAITTKREIEKLKRIRRDSKFVLAIGACANTGGIPQLKNVPGKKEKRKYVYSQAMLKDSIDPQPISKFIKVDYGLQGCPIVKKQFEKFAKEYLKKYSPTSRVSSTKRTGGRRW